MASTKVISIVLAAKDKALAPIRRVIGGIRSLGSKTVATIKRIVGSARTLLKLATSVKTLVAGIIALQLGRALVNDLAFVEKQAAQVATITGETGREKIRALGEDIRAAAVRGGQSFESSFAAAYRAVSTGVARELLPSFLDTANKLAVAGATDAETAVGLLTNAINAYGKSMREAADVSDIFFVVVNKGDTTVDQIAASLFQVAPAAAEAGLGMDQVGASIAALTAAGTPTRVATTQIRQMLVELGKEGTSASRVFERIAGVGFRDFVRQGGSIADALELIRDEAVRSGKSVGDLFGSVEARLAAATLAGNGFGILTDTLAEMGDRAGATDDAFATMADTLSFSLERAKGALRDLVLTTGDLTIAPVVGRFADEVAKMSQEVRDLVRGVRDGLIDASTGTDLVRDLLRAAGDLLVEGIKGIFVVVGTIAIEAARVAMNVVGSEAGVSFALGFSDRALGMLESFYKALASQLDGIFGSNLEQQVETAFMVVRPIVRSNLNAMLGENKTSAEEIGQELRTIMTEAGSAIESQTNETLGRMGAAWMRFKEILGRGSALLTAALPETPAAPEETPNPDPPDEASVSAWRRFKEGFKAGIEDIKKSAGTLSDFVQRITAQVGQKFAADVTSGIFDVFVDKTKSAKEAFKDFAKSTLRMVSQMIIQFLILRAIAGVFGPAGTVGVAAGSTAAQGAQAHTGGRIGRGRVHRFARGGVVPGVSLGRDSVSAMLEPGEYVVRAKAVRQLGRGFMDRVNGGSDAGYEQRIAASVLAGLKRAAGARSAGGEGGGGLSLTVVVQQSNTFDGGTTGERQAREIKQQTKQAVLEALERDRQFRGNVRRYVNDR